MTLVRVRERVRETRSDVVDVVELNQMVVPTEQDGHVQRAPKLVAAHHSPDPAGNNARRDDVLVAAPR